MKLKNPTGSKIIHLKKSEKMKILLEDFDAGSRQFELEIYLESEAAECQIIGRIQTQNNDQKSWRIRQYFQHKNQNGQIELKGSAEGNSFLKFDGAAIIENHSQNGQVLVGERVILFDQAKAQILPILTVKTDQVQSASHAASIAPINPEKIRYCTSRGLPPKVATKLMKEGFLSIVDDSDL